MAHEVEFLCFCGAVTKLVFDVEDDRFALRCEPCMQAGRQYIAGHVRSVSIPPKKLRS